MPPSPIFLFPSGRAEWVGGPLADLGPGPPVLPLLPPPLCLSLLCALSPSPWSQPSVICATPRRVPLAEAQRLPYYATYCPTRLLIHSMCTSHYLDIFITFIICLNVVTMSLEHYNQPPVSPGCRQAQGRFVRMRPGTLGTGWHWSVQETPLSPALCCRGGGLGQPCLTQLTGCRAQMRDGERPEGELTGSGWLRCRCQPPTT